MLARRRRISPFSANSQFSLPYERNQLPEVIVPFVSETNRDAVFGERPKLLDQPVVDLFRPFPREERNNLGAAANELRPISPCTVRCIGQRHALGIARIPTVFRAADFLHGGLARKRRQRRPAFGHRGFLFFVSETIAFIRTIFPPHATLRTAHQKFSDERTPMTNAFLRRLPSGLRTPPPGRIMYCRSGCSVHHGVT